MTLLRLGDTHSASGYRDAARDAWRQALEIFDGLGHREAATVRSKLHLLAIDPQTDKEDH
jgi:predicted TPR repeat methyltransferase